jgi:hypothetical protein
VMDDGGYLKPGRNIVNNYTGGAEPVLTSHQWAIASQAIQNSVRMLEVMPNVLKSGSLARMSATTTRAYARSDAAERRVSSVAYPNGGGATELHFHGDLSFPNVRNEDDAEMLITHLKSLGPR